jgi:hypothetical protein
MRHGKKINSEKFLGKSRESGVTAAAVQDAYAYLSGSLEIHDLLKLAAEVSRSKNKKPLPVCRKGLRSSNLIRTDK